MSTARGPTPLAVLIPDKYLFGSGRIPTKTHTELIMTPPQNDWTLQDTLSLVADAGITPLVMQDSGVPLNNVFQACPPFAFLREFIINCLLYSMPQKQDEGVVTLYVGPDWPFVKATMKKDKDGNITTRPTYRLTMLHTGRGMTGDELVTSMRTLFRYQEGLTTYGIGLRVALLSCNPNGVLVMSWVNGVGHMVLLRKHPDSENFGLQNFILDNGEETEVMPTPEEYNTNPYTGKPMTDGVMVIALGDDDHPNTMHQLPGYPDYGNYRTLKAINKRFYRFPDNLHVWCWTPDGDLSQWPTKPGRVRRRTGQSSGGTGRSAPGCGTYFIPKTEGGKGKFTQDHGIMETDRARYHWFVFSGHKGRGGTLSANNPHSLSLSTGQISILMPEDQAGVLEVFHATRRRWGRFGVFSKAAYSRMALFIEPKTNDIHQDLARGSLFLSGNEPLPWDNYGMEFGAHMPEPVKELIREVAEGQDDLAIDMAKSKTRIQDALNFYESLGLGGPGGFARPPRRGPGNPPPKKPPVRDGPTNPPSRPGTGRRLPSYEVVTDADPKHLFVYSPGNTQVAVYRNHPLFLFLHAKISEAAIPGSEDIVTAALASWLGERACEAILGQLWFRRNGTDSQWKTQQVSLARKEEALTNIALSPLLIVRAVRSRLGRAVRSTN